MSEPLWQPRSDTSARVLGAAFLLGGLGLVALQARSILGAIADGSAVTYFASAIALGEAGAIFGAFVLVRGLAGYQAVRRLQQNPGAMRWLGFAAAVVIGGSVLALHYWLRAQGYDA